MITEGGLDRDLAALVVPPSGRLVATGDRYEPYQLVDPGGAVVDPVTAYFRDLLAAGRSELTVRSYGFDLVRWFRFCWAAGVGWDRATRIEARDFCRWLQVTGKQSRPHWRAPGQAQAAGAVPAGGAYAPSVRAHTETVLRGFYDFHLQAGSGPVINPFPLVRPGRGGRAHAHHNPMEPYRDERTWPLPAEGCLPGPAQRPGRASSTRSSRRCPRTGTGRWWRSMSRPGRGHQSCCRRPWAALSRGGS